MSGITTLETLITLYEERLRKVEISIATVYISLETIKDRLDRTITLKDCAMIAAILAGALLGAWL